MLKVWSKLYVIKVVGTVEKLAQINMSAAKNWCTSQMQFETLKRLREVLLEIIQLVKGRARIQT